MRQALRERGEVQAEAWARYQDALRNYNRSLAGEAKWKKPVIDRTLREAEIEQLKMEAERHAETLRTMRWVADYFGYTDKELSRP